MNPSSDHNDVHLLEPYSPRRYLEVMSDDSSESHVDSEPLSFSSDCSDYQFPDPRSHPGSEHWYHFNGSNSPQANLCPLPAAVSAILSTESEPGAAHASFRKQLIPRHTHSQITKHEPTQAVQKAQTNQHKYSTRIAPNISTRPSGPSQDGGVPQGEPATIAYMRPNSLRSPQACDACRRRKVRCVVPASSQSIAGHVNGDPDPRVCMRCIRMNLKCVWGDARRGRQKNFILPKAAQEGPAPGDIKAPSEDTTQFSNGKSSTPSSIRSPSDLLPVTLPSPGASHHRSSFSLVEPAPYTGHDPHLPLPYTYPSVATHIPAPTQHQQYSQYLPHQMYHTIMRPSQIDGPSILDDFPFTTPRSYHNASPMYAPAPVHAPPYYAAAFHEPSNLDYLQHPSDHTASIPGGPSSYPGNTHIVPSNGSLGFRNSRDGGQQGSPHATSMGMFTPFDGDLRGISLR